MSSSNGVGGMEAVLAAFTATAMIAHQVAAKTARDSLFLTYFDVTWLPTVTIVAALVSAAAVLLMSGLLARRGPARLIPPIYAGSGVIFTIEWVLMSWQPRVTTILLFLHISALGSILISGFWSIINERYDPYQGKRVIARLAAAATLGGLLGGLAASAVASLADTRGILLMLAGMHLFCSLALAYVARGSVVQAPDPSVSTHRLLLEPLKRSGLIRRMAVLVALVAINAAVLDYLLKSMASAEFSSDPDKLVHFFSSFYVLVGLGGFLMQTFVGNKALGWLGLGGTMAALPAFVLTGGLFAFLFRHLMTVAALRAGTAVFYNSFFRAGFESLYTPIPARDKRASKLLIDVGADRTGDMLGGLLVMGILLGPAAATDNLLFFTAGVLSLLVLLLIVALHRGYVRQLASNLRDGTLQASEITAVDATTRHTIALTQTALSRDDLLREIALSRRAPRGLVTVEPAAHPSPPATSDPVIENIIELRSGERERIRRVLNRTTATPELLPHLIPLLAREEQLRDVLQVLKPMASSASGQLVDALLDRRRHPLVRRRLPLILARADNLMAVQGLMDCLGDEDADVRFRCGQALSRIRGNHHRLAFPLDALWTCIRAELAALAASEAGQLPVDEGGQLHHLFNLLGVIYSPETLEVCFRSLSGGDGTLRGTALEYLDNQLPQDIKERLWPAVAPDGGVKGSKRALPDIARELLRASRFQHRKTTAGSPDRQGGEETHTPSRK